MFYIGKLSDSWDFNARLQGVLFPSLDSQHVCEWVKQKHNHRNANNCNDDCSTNKGQNTNINKASCCDNDGVNINKTRYSNDYNFNRNNESYDYNDNHDYADKGIIGNIESNNCDYNCNNNCDSSGNSKHHLGKEEGRRLDINEKGSLTIQMGDFLSFYSHKHQQNQFDCVVTCFFIDTATNIIDYLAVISHILRPGGIFLNTGPLHYHSNNTIQYSYKQLIEIILIGGFDVISQSQIDATSYSGEEEFSMKPEYYTVPLDIFQLNRKQDRWPLPGNEVTDIDDYDIDDEHGNDTHQRNENHYAERPDFILN
jgi:SAM-dependent methyltransferase